MKKIVCAYCGTKYDAEAPRCPSCGGANPQPAEAPSEAPQGLRKPKTIRELQDFAAAHKLPLNKMRVHLGEDYAGARAYGIYQAEDGSFVVYKNKADGSRAVRYQGPDEAHAVNELYLKMKELVGQHKSRQQSRQSSRPAPRRSAGRGASSFLGFLRNHPWVTVLLILLVIVIWQSCRNRSPKSGYYHYNNDYYYHQGSNWYVYHDSWVPAYPDSGLTDRWDDYYESSYYNSSYDADSFYNSDYYESPAQNQNNDWDWGGDNDDWDWDDDDDWDWGDDDDWDWGGDDDWDWGGDDWDSDW